MTETVYAAFAEAARAAPDNDFLVIPPSAAKPYAPDGLSLSYAQAFERIEARRAQYAEAGYRHGHRVALLLENRPAFLEHWLALNALGVSVVPINPYYQAGEMRYLLDHSDAALGVALGQRVDELARAAGNIGRTLPVIDEATADVPPPALPATGGEPGPHSECGLLYTSGTTGRPKGCMLSNQYYLMVGRWYVEQGGPCAIEPGAERMLTPLPLCHMNAMACSFTAMVLTRNCLILLDRFHPATWWSDVRTTGATIVHYLGVIPAILIERAEHADERAHAVKFGFGANVDPAHHAAFEQRFGVPLIEGWAMTETGAGAMVAANREPRHPGTRCFGTEKSCEVRLVDDAGGEVTAGEPGHLLVRRKGPDPHEGFFTGYYKDEPATAAAWQGGWFHTGDIVRRGPDGSLHFVDRSKNIIRRSGENIAALEVESVLLGHRAAAQVAVIAVPDELRDEEVMACVVPAEGATRTRKTAEDLVRWTLARLAYFKAPGYVLFLDALPVTSTNKVRKVTLQEMGGDPRGQTDCFDLRDMKRAR